jgi:protein SCO1/2
MMKRYRTSDGRARAIEMGRSVAALLAGAWLVAAAGPTLAGAAPGATALDPDAALALSQSVIGRQVGGYAFVDRQGRQVRLADYRGKPLVVSFVYTGCFSVCPTTTARVAKAIRAARKTLGTGAFNVITIGFNLPYDSPEAMREFARRYGIDDPNWEFLTPFEQELPRLVADFGFQYVATAGGFDHITQLTVLDPQGRVYRQVYGEDFALPLFIGPLQELITGSPMPMTSLADLVERIRIICTIYDPRTGSYRFKTSIVGDIVSFIGVTLVLFWFVWHGRRKRREAAR